MGLEASDLNDGTILQQTKQTKDARGNITFSIELPSKRVLKSEVVPADRARDALKVWLQTVKEQAVADSNAERLERAAKASRGKMDLERRPGDDQPLFRAGGARVEDKPAGGPSPDVPDTVRAEPVPAAVGPVQGPVYAAVAGSPEDFIAAKIAELQRQIRKWEFVRKSLEEFD